MGRRRAGAAVAAILLAGFSATFAAAAPPRLTFDWSDQPDVTPLECDAGCPGCRLLFDSQKFRAKAKKGPLTKAEATLVRQAYLQYLTSDRCTQDETHLDPKQVGTKEDRAEIEDVLTGAFTEKGKQQKLVLFFAGHCGAPGFRPENWGQRFMILFERESVQKIWADDGSWVLRAVDLDGDGRQELLHYGGYYGAGGGATWISLESLADGVRRGIGNFEVASDGCGFPDGDRSESTVLYRWSKDDQFPCFEQRTQQLACGRAGQP